MKCVRNKNHQRALVIGVTAFLNLLGFSSVQSAVLPDLYVSEQLVSDQSSGELRTAAREGLREVLVRVAGTRDVLDREPVRDAIQRPNGMLLQYGYVGQAFDEEGELKQRLRLEFDKRAIGDLYRQEEIPVWSAQRPEVLLWLVFDEPDSTRYISPDTTPDITAALIDDLQERGIPWRFPLFDLEDELRANMQQVMQLDTSSVARAAQRYNSQAVLLGRVLRLTDGRLIGDWTYVQELEEINLHAEAEFEAELFPAAIDTVANRLAAAYAITPRRFTANGYLLRIDGVASFADYTQMVASLEAIDAVSHANVEQIRPGILELRLQADGSIEQLQRAIALGTRLIPIPQVRAEARSILAPELSYRWPATRKLTP